MKKFKFYLCVFLTFIGLMVLSSSAFALQSRDFTYTVSSQADELTPTTSTTTTIQTSTTTTIQTTTTTTVILPAGWEYMPSGTTNISMVSGAVLAAMCLLWWCGTILHYNGSTWSAMTSGTTNSSLWCLGQFRQRCICRGYYGTILHYNGSSWSAMTSGTTN